jgi:starvation-inducible DNA-binding protein
MNGVQSGLSASDRTQLSRAVADVLADTYVLLIKTHVYHWNVVGPLFVPVHQLLEVHYKDLFAAADELAERIRGLGHLTPLSFGKDLLPRSEVDEEKADRSAAGMLKQLVADHEEIARRIRGVSADAADRKDFVTHDLLNGRLAFHEKAIWMLRAIIAEEGDSSSTNRAAKSTGTSEPNRTADVVKAGRAS